MYIIRADGNARIGAGHLMRCMTIADELKKSEGQEDPVLFLCGEEQSAAMAAERGFQAEVLPKDEPSAWAEILARRGGRGKHVALVDSYRVTDAYLEGLKRFGRVALLDDMGRRPFPVDCVINYNAPADREAYERMYAGSGSRIVTGSRYVPLRPQFLHRGFQVRPEVKRVLITTGGGDIDNIARRILDKLYDAEREYDLIIGRFNPHFEEMKALAESRGNVVVLHDVAEMARLMEDCDVAVTAGGTTVYELAAVGVPFICFSYAENQEALTEYLGSRGIAGMAGAYHREQSGTLEEIGRLFGELTRDRGKRERFCKAGRAMTDGGGAGRIADVLRELMASA